MRLWCLGAGILFLVDSITSVRAVGNRRALPAVMELVAMSGSNCDKCTLLALLCGEARTLATRGGISER